MIWLFRYENAEAGDEKAPLYYARKDIRDVWNEDWQ